MRRPFTLTAVATALVGLSAACNGILGIGAPTLVEKDAGEGDGGASHDATRDGRGDAAQGDARGDGTGGKDATTDAPAHDAKSDGREDAGDASPPSDGATFDGNCTCTGDACAPVVLAHVPLGLSSISNAPSGVCFYSSDVLVSPFAAFVGCVGWDGTLTVIDSTGQDPGTVATRGGTIYWVHTNAIEDCTIASCSPKGLAAGGFFEGQMTLGANEIYWVQSDGVHECALTGECDGGAPIPGSNSSVLSANSSGVFWINASTSLIQFCAVGGCPDGGTTLNVDGGAMEMQASDTDLYWFATATGDIVTCPLAGGACQSAPRVLVPSAASLNVRHFAVDSSGLYWTNETSNAIERVRLDGGTVATLAHTAMSSFTSTQLALGTSCLFWGDTEGDAGVLYASPK